MGLMLQVRASLKVAGRGTSRPGRSRSGRSCSAICCAISTDAGCEKFRRVRQGAVQPSQDVSGALEDRLWAL